ncbi:MAG: hypothetical protein H7Z14_10045 [Anaerolineae bacterium]|nr:hypothetical protein [Phycisphaerae bacterium]
MKTLFRLIVLVLLVAGWGLAALSLHVVRARGAQSGNDRIVLIPKQRLNLTDTYVDARAWTLANVGEHEQLVERIIQSGKADSFAYVVEDPKGDVERQLEDALKSSGHDEDHPTKSIANNVRKHAKAASTWWDLGK